MTEKELVKLIFDALVKQGGPSLGEDGGCAYRGRNGRRCAAGVLMKDEEYSPKFEGTMSMSEGPWTAIVRSNPQYADYPYLIRSMQLAHDTAAEEAPFATKTRWRNALLDQMGKQGIPKP